MKNGTLILFLAGLLATVAGAYVLASDYNLSTRMDRLEQRVDRKLESIESKVDQLLDRKK